MNKTKICCRCHREKSVLEFSQDKNRKDGLQNACKICKKQYDKQWNSEHKKEIKLYNKKWNLEHRKEKKLRAKQYYIEHKEKINLSCKQWNSEHKDEKKLINRQWRLGHKNEININNKKYQNQRYKTNDYFRTIKILRSRMNNALRVQGVKKSLKTLDCLGCTAIFYQNYLKSLFKAGMTLANNGTRKWQQHHIVECHKFDLSDLEQQRKCFHYTNIIPMWEDEHKALHANGSIF